MEKSLIDGRAFPTGQSRVRRLLPRSNSWSYIWPEDAIVVPIYRTALESHVEL